MAKRKNTIEKKVEIPEESLAEVLSPTYTLEPAQDIIAVAPGEVDVHIGFATFSIQFNDRTYTNDIHMILRIERTGASKTESSYNFEDVQDAYALGSKVDALLSYRRHQDRYSFETIREDVKKIDDTLSRDFSRFYEEFERNGIFIRNELKTSDILANLHKKEAIEITYEVRL